MEVIVTHEIFAKYHNYNIIKYILATKTGFSVAVLNYGGIIWELNTPDKNNKVSNVVINHGEFNPLNPGYLGAIIGRVAGRIKNAKFTVDNEVYQLKSNENNNLLHGGILALDKKIWQVASLANGIELTYFSPDLEEGFPGNVEFKVRYLIEDDFQLTIEATATTDKRTPINLTNHSYFNLTGELINGNRQLLRIDSEYYGLINREKLFTNRFAQTKHTPFDFTTAKPIIQDIFLKDQQLEYGNGYDHPFVLNRQSSYPIELIDSISGRNLRIKTTESFVVVYSANHFALQASAICLETQQLPDAVNFSEYHEGIICSPDKPYCSKTIWQFGLV